MASPQGRKPPPSRPRWLGDLGTLAIIGALFGAVYLLPPDNSFEAVEKAGRITACMPTLYPPLVTADPAEPGFDVELMGLIAEQLGLRLTVLPNAAMAKDFNPRSWRVTRAQCQVLAGGIALTTPVLSYLDATAPYLSTGWAVVSKEPLANLEDKSIGFYAGLSGLDRVALSRQLRAMGLRPRIVNSAEALEQGLSDGTFDVGISEALVARQIAGANDWSVAWAPGVEERYPIGIGLWKGDLTLKRKLVSALGQLEADGSLDALKQKYDIADIGGVMGGGAVPDLE
ncbi:cystine transporter subunit [Devosia equisanguinis]|uniref:Cystine transporter subunit n=1 Tax=Devosia equisanguinis TaxID=2490941 RepID=A0A3S4CDZ4_9HYPH|nr:transporter substrate-binding domain-containing protein [Devosia equisanguinis]VDS05951.1 cystine transporter subunit [Devosia equisanguinis]